MRTLIALSFCLTSPLAVHAGGLAETIVEPAPTTQVAPPPPARSDGDWTGFYAGVEAYQLDGDVFVAGTDTEAATFSGTLGGVHAGYLYDFGRFVLGAEVGADFGDAGWEAAATGAAIDFNTDSVLRAVVKAGLDLDRILIYGLGGLTSMTVEDTTGLAGADPEDADGSVLGLGAAFQASGPWVGSLEYHVMDFDPFNGDDRFEAEATGLAARISFRF